jgi:methylglutaconyl-CoA hydratase
MDQFVKTSFADGIARVTLDRPDKRNALTRDFVDRLRMAVDQLRTNEQLRVLVLQANGPAFCAGMDLEEMQLRARSDSAAVQFQRDSEIYCDLLTILYAIPVPTIAAVQGPALAGGVGLVVSCDLVIASDTAYFTLPEPVRGIMAAMVTPLLIHRVGAGRATYMLLSGEKIPATMALAAGLCHDVVPANQLMERVDRLVRSVLTGSPKALAMTKKHIKRCLAVDPVEQVRKSIAVSATARETDDAREGLAAFLEKRQPAWQPKR